MKCMSCGSSNVFVFLVEKIPCSHCNNLTDLSYCTCESCGNIWRVIEGVPVEEGFMQDYEGEKNVLNELKNVSLEEFEIAIKRAEKEISNREYESNTMSEMFHRCLRCNHIAYEISSRQFQCPDCGFEWEVL